MKLQKLPIMPAAGCGRRKGAEGVGGGVRVRGARENYVFKSVTRACRHTMGGRGAIAHQDRNTAPILATH